MLEWVTKSINNKYHCITQGFLDKFKTFESKIQAASKICAKACFDEWILEKNIW